MSKSLARPQLLSSTTRSLVYWERLRPNLAWYILGSCLTLRVGILIGIELLLIDFLKVEFLTLTDSNTNCLYDMESTLSNSIFWSYWSYMSMNGKKMGWFYFIFRNNGLAGSYDTRTDNKSQIAKEMTRQVKVLWICRLMYRICIQLQWVHLHKKFGRKKTYFEGK